jgi:hypothetical protein
MMKRPTPLTWKAFQICVISIASHGLVLILLVSGTDLLGGVVLVAAALSSGA